MKDFEAESGKSSILTLIYLINVCKQYKYMYLYCLHMSLPVHVQIRKLSHKQNKIMANQAKLY